MLGINSPAVTIKNIENSIIDYGFQHGWVHPMPPAVRTGRKIAVVGSGPAGLAAAAQLNKVLERACCSNVDRGMLLRCRGMLLRCRGMLLKWREVCCSDVEVCCSDVERYVAQM